MADSNQSARDPESIGLRKNWLVYLIVFLIAGTIYLGCIVSPPSLMDDVDAVQAQIARNMLTSGDWVTARLDGVIYLEKSPLHYWINAAFYELLGISDWAARVPYALSSIALALLTTAFGIWAFRKEGRLLRRSVYSHLCRIISLHPHLDSGRNADLYDCVGDVGIPSSPRSAGDQSSVMGH